MLTEDSFPIKEDHSIQPHWEYIFRQKKQVLSARAVMQKKRTKVRSLTSPKKDVVFLKVPGSRCVGEAHPNITKIIDMMEF